MNRVKVNSSNHHSVGHDDTGLEVQFHAAGCARSVKPKKGDPVGACNCAGGDVWRYPGVGPEVHAAVVNSPSIGSAFHRYVLSVKNPTTNLPLYPGVKVEPKAI